MRFAADGSAPDKDPRCVRVGLRVLGDQALQEHWRSPVPVQSGQHDGFGYSENGDVLFAQMRVEEEALDNMERATFEAYNRIGTFTRARGYPNLLRTWNYFHDIHRGDGDHERYRQFVAGRYRALAGQADFAQSLPAATAIGTREPGMLIYFLAGRIAGRQVENPRQVSAFEYPPQYGPRSPSFSRAALVRAEDGDCLLVSGTASIVGHASRHPGDAAAQLQEIARNLEALRQSVPGAGWRPGSLKLYLREPAQLAMLSALFQQHFGTLPLCCEGDICRRDLLVEIEGTFTTTRV